MENIVIVHAVSTGYNLVDDVIARGFYPVVLNILHGGDEADELRDAVRPRIEGKCRFIDECEDYADTLETVRKLKPRVVLAGSEGGVILATRLAEDLGLVGNPTGILPQMTQKAAMHEALKEHGLRSVRGKLVSTPDEAAAFFDELKVRKVVVKQNGGASSVGLHICASRDETADAVRSEIGTVDHFGRVMKNVLIQEMIEGTEYIVNSVSCAGDVRLTSVFRYMKTRTENGGVIYRYTESINDLGMKEYELIRYAFQTVQALGIQYGAVHGEYMIDEYGPVLIEVNCRPMGLTMPGAYVDMLNGQHETDSHLDAYLYPEKFAEEAKKPYRTNYKLVIKSLSSKTEKTLLASPILVFAPKLKSYVSANLKGALSEIIRITEDLASSCGTLYLAHRDREIVIREAEFLCELEDYYSEMIFQETPITRIVTEWNKPETSIDEIVRIMGFGDDYTIFDVSQENAMTNKKGAYSNVILFDSKNGNKSWTIEDSLDAMFELVNSMKKGSKMVLTRGLHEMDRQGIAYSIVAMKLAGLTVECPMPGYLDLIVGTVN